MSYGIVTKSVAPVREEQSCRSGRVTEVLFGELVEVEEEAEAWSRVRTSGGVGGWMESAFVARMDEAYVEGYGRHPRAMVRDVFGIVRREGDWESRMVVAGSVLPFYDAATRRFRLGGETYVAVCGVWGNASDARSALARHAFVYHNAPCLWGGRSPLGIDSVGLVQMAFRLTGVEVPGDMEGLARYGEALSFMEEARAGDVAFFGDASGALSHVGIVWEGGHVIHASGRVRVDRLDHNGIYNDDIKRYTHSLKLLRRFL